MKAIFTFIFLVLSIISYSQKNKENLDKEILRLLNKYFSTTISSSSILSQNSGGNPILATREFKIKNDITPKRYARVASLRILICHFVCSKRNRLKSCPYINSMDCRTPDIRRFNFLIKKSVAAFPVKSYFAKIVA